MPNTMQNAQVSPSTNPPWSTDWVGVGAAVVSAAVAWFFTSYLGDLELTVQRGSEAQRIGVAAVVLTAGVSALIGFVALRILERLTSRALTIWTVLVVLVTILSLLGPASATSTAAAGALMSLHTVVAAVVIASAQYSRRRRRKRRHAGD